MSKRSIRKRREYRALPIQNEKGLVERRTELEEKARVLIDSSKNEKRALTSDEGAEFRSAMDEIKNINDTLQAYEEERALYKGDDKADKKEKEQRTLDEENFVKFVRGEQRSLSASENGAIIPTTIANRIIKKVKELSPIYSMATIYNLGGDLVFPLYDEENSSIKAKYIDEFEELTEGTGKFKTVKLQSFVVGCLAKVSKSLVNRTDFDLVSFIITEIAKAIAEFMEEELIQGTVGKMRGLASTKNIHETSNAGKIVADDLIDLQMEIPETFQKNATWIMHKSTAKAIRKLKDSEGNYLMGTLKDGFGYVLLNKPVYITESADKIEEGKNAIYYGDMSGLYVKLAKNVDIQVLVEKYATQHAIGACGYIEADSDIVETQKITALKIKASV